MEPGDQRCPPLTQYWQERPHAHTFNIPEIRYKEQGILPVKEEKQDQRTPSEEETEPLRGKGKEREIVSVIHQGSNLGPSGCWRKRGTRWRSPGRSASEFSLSTVCVYARVMFVPYSSLLSQTQSCVTHVEYLDVKVTAAAIPVLLLLYSQGRIPTLSCMCQWAKTHLGVRC